MFPRLGNVYLAEYSNHRIRKVTVSTGIITTIAGSSTSGSYSGDNGPATSAELNYPAGVALDSSGIIITATSIGFDYIINIPVSLIGNVYIADAGNGRIRKVATTTSYPRYFRIFQQICLLLHSLSYYNIMILALPRVQSHRRRHHQFLAVPRVQSHPRRHP